MDARPVGAKPERTAEDLWVDGVWVGPRSLRFFLRVNWFLVVAWFLILCGIALAIWVDVAEVPSWSIPPLAIATGTGATLAFMFGFSRGWIREGD